MYLDRDGLYVIYEGERDRRKVILVKNYDKIGRAHGTPVTSLSRMPSSA